MDVFSMSDVNPYLLCSSRLQELRAYTAEQYNDEIRNLQTSTSQWYLSMLKEPPDPSDSDSHSSPEGPQVLREQSEGQGGHESQQARPVNGLASPPPVLQSGLEASMFVSRDLSSCMSPSFNGVLSPSPVASSPAHTPPPSSTPLRALEERSPMVPPPAATTFHVSDSANPSRLTAATNSSPSTFRAGALSARTLVKAPTGPAPSSTDSGRIPARFGTFATSPHLSPHQLPLSTSWAQGQPPSAQPCDQSSRVALGLVSMHNLTPRVLCANSSADLGTLLPTPGSPSSPAMCHQAPPSRPPEAPGTPNSAGSSRALPSSRKDSISHPAGVMNDSAAPHYATGPIRPSKHPFDPGRPSEAPTGVPSHPVSFSSSHTNAAKAPEGAESAPTVHTMCPQVPGAETASGPIVRSRAAKTTSDPALSATSVAALRDGPVEALDAPSQERAGTPTKTPKVTLPVQEQQSCFAELAPGVLSLCSSPSPSASAPRVAPPLAAFQPSVASHLSPTPDSPAVPPLASATGSLAAFQPSVSILISPQHPSMELSDGLQPSAPLKSANSPKRAGGSDNPAWLRASFPPASPSPAPLDDDPPPLRRVKSLFGQRATMLTPAARCAGGQLLPEVPALQTYRDGPRPRRTGAPPSVMFLYCPVVHTYTKDQETPRSPSLDAPDSTSATTLRCQQNRRRGSYRTARHALEFPPAHPSRMSMSAPLEPPSAVPVVGPTAYSVPLEAIQEQPVARAPARQPSAGSTGPSGPLFSTFGAGLVGPRGAADMTGMSQTMEPSGSHAGCKGSAVAKVPLGDVELSKDSGTAGVLSNWSRSSGGDTTLTIATQESSTCHGNLKASIEVICQALVDSKHLNVHTELGMKIGPQATWIDITVLLIRSLENVGGQRLSVTDVNEVVPPLSPKTMQHVLICNGKSRAHLTDTSSECNMDWLCLNSEEKQICLQIAYIFMPVATAISTLTDSLFSYLAAEGYSSAVRAEEREKARSARESRPLVPAPPDLGDLSSKVLAPEHLASAWESSNGERNACGAFDGQPFEYLTPWLPRAMFDHIACLVSIGVRMDAVAKSHGIENLRALDVIKHQMGIALDELSLVASTIVGATMALCKQPMSQTFQESLAGFLSAALDQMAASVSLINGRLPLDSSEEALQSVASAEQSWTQLRMTSTAFFHSLTVSGYMLCIMEEVAADVATRRGSPRKAGISRGPSPHGLAGLLADSGDDGEVCLDSETMVLMEITSKIQVTGCWLVMLLGSLIKSAEELQRNALPAPTSSVSSGPSPPSSTVPRPPLARPSSQRPSSHAAPPGSPPQAILLPPPSPAGSPLRTTLSIHGSDATSSHSRTLSAATSGHGQGSVAVSSSSVSETPLDPSSPAPGSAANSTGGFTSFARATVRFLGGRRMTPESPTPLPSSVDSPSTPTKGQAQSDTAETPPQPPRRANHLNVCVMNIDEPLSNFGPFSATEQPVSPMSRPLVKRRLKGMHKSQLSCDFAARLSALAVPAEPVADPPLLSPTMGLLDAALQASMRRPASHLGAASMPSSPSHRSVALAYLARVVPQPSALHPLPDRNPSCPQLQASASHTSTPPTELPRSLTLEEVGRIQAALARSLLNLGAELLLVLLERLETLREALVATPAGSATATLRPAAVAATVLRVQRILTAQTAMVHNLERWTAVGTPEDSGMLPEAAASPSPPTLELSRRSVSFRTSSRFAAGAPPRFHRHHALADDRLTAAAAKLQTLLDGLQELTGGSSSAPNEAAMRPMELLLGNAVKPLGKKSMGSVWMHHFGADVAAVKWITLEDDPPNTAGYTAAQKEGMMIREIEAMLHVKHPNIVQLLGVTRMETPAARRPRRPGTGHVRERSFSGSCQPRQLSSSDAEDARERRFSDSHGGSAAADTRPLPQATLGIVLELCRFGTLQDFINDTRALCNSSRLRAVEAGGFALRRGFCTTPAEAMSMCFINSWAARLRVCREIASALAACHAAGVLHRDLTSFNVMLSDMHDVSAGAQDDALCWREPNEDDSEAQCWSLPWSTRLIDFGLSKRFTQGQSPLTCACTIDTHSIAWMAPETFTNSRHLPASDVYSLGMIIWEVVTLSMPPTAKIASYIASGQAFASSSRDAVGPCDAALSEILALHAVGNAAALVRRCHGVMCPVLEPLVELIRRTHRFEAADRPAATEVAAELARLEAACRNVPPPRVPSTGEHMLSYWRDSTTLGAECSLESFRTQSDDGEGEGEEAAVDAEGAAWVQSIVRIEEYEDDGVYGEIGGV